MSLLTLENITASPIVTGDAGVILKEDGTFRIFNTHETLNPSAMTPQQMEQGKKLIALAVALQVPQVMEILFQVSSDPTIVGAVLDPKIFQ